MLQRRADEKHARDQMKEAALAATWFRPETTTKSVAILTHARPQQLVESPAERIERMTNEEVDSRQRRQKQLEHDVYGGLSFRPAIDPISRALGRDTDLDELSENRRGKQKLETIRRQVETNLRQECSFRPQINELSRMLLAADPADLEFAARYNAEFVSRGWAESAFEQLERLQEHPLPPKHITSRINMQDPEKMARDIRWCQQDKEERRRADMLVREVEELRECTFQPQIPSYNPDDNNHPVVIRGLGRHLELKQLSSRQKAEAAQREKEVFTVVNVDKYRRAEVGSTIVQVNHLIASHVLSLIHTINQPAVQTQHKQLHFTRWSHSWSELLRRARKWSHRQSRQLVTQ